MILSKKRNSGHLVLTSLLAPWWSAKPSGIDKLYINSIPPKNLEPELPVYLCVFVCRFPELPMAMEVLVEVKWVVVAIRISISMRKTSTSDAGADGTMRNEISPRYPGRHVVLNRFAYFMRTSDRSNGINSPLPEVWLWAPQFPHLFERWNLWSWTSLSRILLSHLQTSIFTKKIVLSHNINLKECVCWGVSCSIVYI